MSKGMVSTPGSASPAGFKTPILPSRRCRPSGNRGHALAGQDASEAFEDIGHSKSAREMLKQYEIGELVGTPVKKAKGVAKGGAAGGSGGMSKILIPVVIVGGIAFLAQRFMA